MYNFEGHVDFYGYHTPAGGWFVGGWLAHPWPLGHRPANAEATFPETSLSDHTHTMFYPRQSLCGRGIGFVFFLRSPDADLSDLHSMRINSAGIPYDFYPTPSVLRLAEPELTTVLRDLLEEGEHGSQLEEFRALILGTSTAAATGFIDIYGHHAASNGWLCGGWMRPAWPTATPPDRIILSFEDGDVGSDAFAIKFQRIDLTDGAEGVVFFVRGPAALLGKLCLLSFEVGEFRATLATSATSARLRETQLIATLRPTITLAPPGPQRDALLGLLSRQPFAGEDTLASLRTPVFIEVDEAILAGNDGLVLAGWLLYRPRDIRAIRLRSGNLVTTLDFDAGIRIDRSDVLTAFAQHGFSNPRCGYILFIPSTAFTPEGPTYFEVETTRHEIGYRNIPTPRLEGIAAIKRLLSVVDVRFGEVQPAFDRVLGPAIEGLNKARLAQRPTVERLTYGRLPSNPRFSVIVPLYGRLDFVEYQLALFSEHPHCAEAEFIYVLDDPAKAREAQFLFASVYERFLIPFKALLLSHNVGFAPANNIGLAHATGTYIAYLNSDVFPGTLDWLERLAARLEADPSIGVIGPALLFEDGSVQHRGMYFSRLPEFGNWFFGMHLDKGRRLITDGTLENHLSITGACMLMRRDLAGQLGGLDERYIIGDFEDSDLCLQLQALGYRCVIDPEVRLFHLERKSQAGSEQGWRMNLTVYNAWQHQRRWAPTIAARQAEPAAA